MNADSVRVRDLGLCEYLPIYHQMREFSLARQADDWDEFWLLEHNPVYTLGLNGKQAHILNAGNVPVVSVDRGGQVTYHGPGQLIAYVLLDMRRKSLGVRAVVSAMENALVALLADMNINAAAKPEAPGVYVADKKIAALGLRIKNGKSYHGLSLNVDMDLSPFDGINPCGYENLEVVQIKQLKSTYSKQDIKQNLVTHLMRYLQYSRYEIMNEHDQ
ncbi:MAG TPA: lipoyl(octanoyl) transferase LipB [Gammaproteobacteria bacterium]|nr:lipoyl(octanoyl) transferase LipB [Gammaproteobacteria bacterium]